MADVFTPTMQSQIESLLAQQTARSDRTTPIHQAAMAMAARMAPGYAQSAMTGSSAAPPAGGSLFPPPSSSSGGPGVGSTATLALFAALMKNPAFMSALKGLMSSGATGPSGSYMASNMYNVPNSPGAGGFPTPGGGGGSSDPTQPGATQGQGVGIGLPFFSAYGGSGSPATGGSGQQPNYSDEDSRQSY